MDKILFIGVALFMGMAAGFALDKTFYITSQITAYRVEYAHGVVMAKCYARNVIINPDAELDTCQISDDRR
jgi:hypothetical protein